MGEATDSVMPTGQELSNSVIVDSTLTLQQALSLKQDLPPSQETLDNLGIVDVQYYSFDDKLHQGQVVIAKDLMGDVREGFDLIKQIKFPVFSVTPRMDRKFMDPDEKAATINNSCGFSSRLVANTDEPSNHSFGRAFDINPAINPYVKPGYEYLPGVKYDPEKPGTLTVDGEIVQFFKAHGWEWGGEWTDKKDYMHFQKVAAAEDVIEGEVGHQNVFEVKVDPDISKDESYKEQLQGITPEAFFVLGGGNRKIEDSKGNISYKTSPYTGKFFPAKTGGAKARPIATVELSKYYPDAKIVTMSHRPKTLYTLTEQATVSAEIPPFAQILAADIQRAGVAEQRIIQEPASTSTLTEMMEVILMSANHDWKNVAIITNDYQIERGQKIVALLKDEDKRKQLREQLGVLFQAPDEQSAFSKKWQELEEAIAKIKTNNLNIVFASAENVLKKRSPHYETLVDELMELDGYKNVVEGERVGDEKIDSGEYDFAQPTFKEYIMGTGSSV
jgi:hypothetical protein